MKMSDTEVSIAGVLRCCFSGLGDIAEDADVIEGQHAPCKHCSDKEASGLILVGKTWTAAWFEQEKRKATP